MDSVKDKVYKKHPLFVEEVQGLNIEQLEARIVGLQKGLEESEAHREANEELKNARDAYATLRGPYDDVRNAVKLKTRFIVELIREKGGA